MSEDKEYKELLGDVRSVMEQKAGKNLIWDILSKCGIYTYTQDGIRFLEGRRSVGIDILALLEDADPTIYGRLILEKHDGRRTDSSTNNHDTTGFDTTG